MATIRILLADDHAILRSGLRLHLEGQPEMHIVGEAEDSAQAVRLAAELTPDVLVLDITMPGTSGLEVIARIRQASPETQILILTMHDDPAYLKTALAAGAAGYLVKTSADSELVAAIRAVRRGRSYIAASLADTTLRQDQLQRGADDAQREQGEDVLSDRERQVLTMVAYGHTYKEIARELDVSIKTIETYRTRLGEKLGLKSRVDLVRYALEHDLLHPEGASHDG